MSFGPKKPISNAAAVAALIAMAVGVLATIGNPLCECHSECNTQFHSPALGKEFAPAPQHHCGDCSHSVQNEQSESRPAPLPQNAQRSFANGQPTPSLSLAAIEGAAFRGITWTSKSASGPPVAVHIPTTVIRA